MFSFKALKDIYLARLIFYLILLLIGAVIFYRLTYYTMPFLLAFIMASMFEPFIKFMVLKFKFSRRLSAVIGEILFILIVGSLLYLLISRIVIEIKNLVVELPGFLESTYEIIRDFIQARIDDITLLTPEFTSSLDTAFSTLLDNVSSLVSTVLTTTFVTVTMIPEIIIFIAVTLLAAYFMAADRQKIAAYFEKISPKKLYENVKNTRNDIFTAVFGWIKAQGILMIITFILVYVSFNVLSWIIPEVDIKYRLTIAFLIALVDAFPIMGTGTVLIPWAIYSFATGSWQLGLTLIGIFFVTIIVRQLIEPKILGRQIGLHPLITLISMYLGLQIIGFLGILLGPITALIVRNVLRAIMHEHESPEESFIDDIPS